MFVGAWGPDRKNWVVLSLENWEKGVKGGPVCGGA